MPTSKEARTLIEKFRKSEKQKSFQYDFFVDESKYEKWEDVKIGQEGMAERNFKVKMEDILTYLDGTFDNHPLFRDEKFAKKTPWGELIAPPFLIVPIAFWCTGTSSGSWIRTPGAINPGQKIEFYEPIRVGDTITIKAKAYDKYIKRGKNTSRTCRNLETRRDSWLQSGGPLLYFQLQRAMRSINLLKAF